MSGVSFKPGLFREPGLKSGALDHLAVLNLSNLFLKWKKWQSKCSACTDLLLLIFKKLLLVLVI